MAKLSEVVELLETELGTAGVPDYPNAYNGLQLQNEGEVGRVACAVDASLPVIEKAVADGADLLVVHHGMFWQGVRMLTGAAYSKLKIAMDSGLAIYSSHIPLDVHPELGNNVRLSRALGLGDGEPFFNWKGITLGRRATYIGNLGDLRKALELAVGGSVLLRGDENGAAGTVGIITGGAGSEIEAMVMEGIETFVTGEGPHWSHSLAEELGLNVLYAGHYATETFGVKALGQLLEQRFSLKWAFIDYPSGL
ncbi:Nif3-like dinuclear metal center hexameric protein [Akkermansiaceae bacterium]|nr:Nif3-like dinuclear metal center hexameric protein [Akkermansiaceae bacterium]